MIARDLDDALAFADALAPEHLELLLRDPQAALPKVSRAAAVFAGHHAPVPVGDYLAGPNHTLPTSGTARFASPLGATDFLRRQNVIEYGARQLAADAPERRSARARRGPARPRPRARGAPQMSRAPEGSSATPSGRWPPMGRRAIPLPSPCTSTRAPRTCRRS